MEMDYSDKSDEQKSSPPTEAQGISGFITSNDPILGVPSDVISEANSVPLYGNRLKRRHLRWAILNGWQQANREQAFGPTIARTEDYMANSDPFDSPNGFVYYADQLIPSGVEVLITPGRVIYSTPSATITPTLPNGLSFDASTYTISGSALEVTENTRYVVTLRGSTGTFRTAFRLQVYNPTDCENVIEYSELKTTAATGIPYSLVPNEWIIQPGATPIVNPTLPTGLSFTSATGVISGTSTQVTPYKVYTVRALGAGACSALTFGDAFYLGVCGTGYPSAVYNIQATSIPVNTAKTFTPAVYQNIGRAIVSPTLPTGLTFVSATGVISGTPTVAVPPKIYTVAYSGTGAFSSIEDSTSLSFSVCSVSHPTPSTIHWEVIPITTSASDWPVSDQNFTGTFKIVDHRVSPPSSVTLDFGRIPYRHPLIWIFQRSQPYRCNILLRRGSYPMFRFKKGNGWNDAWTVSGIRGVRFIAEEGGEAVKFAFVNSLEITSFSSLNGSPHYRSGLMRDIQFSGCYFSGVDQPGTAAQVIGFGSNNTWVPGLHFYDCTFDGKRRACKWLMRLYGAHDLRLIRCIFKDNWTVNGPGNYPNVATEHAFYVNADAGNNYIIGCTFSGVSRNAIQINSYKTYYGLNDNNHQPRCSGTWVIRDCSAIECGLGSWSYNAAQNTVSYQNNNNGSVFYTIAGASAVFMQNCHASGGFNTVHGFNIDKSTGALVVWKNPATSGFGEAMKADPEFYGNKVFVLSNCQFHMNFCQEFDMVNLKNIRQLWVSGGVYNYRGNRSVFAVSGRSSTSIEEQGINPSGLPYIASAYFNFPLNTTTFPQGYPPSFKANCVDLVNCQLLNQTQIAALVNAADQPPPAPPAVPAEGSFLFEAGYTSPINGQFIP